MPKQHLITLKMWIIFDALFSIHSVAVHSGYADDVLTQFFVSSSNSSVYLCKHSLMFGYLCCCKTNSHLWQRSDADIEMGSVQARCSWFLNHIPTISKLKPLFVVSLCQIPNGALARCDALLALFVWLRCDLAVGKNNPFRCLTCTLHMLIKIKETNKKEQRTLNSYRL